MTSAFEGKLQRGHWWPHRVRLKLKSRRPKQQPSVFAARLEEHGGEVDVAIPAESYPGMIIVDFPPPGVFSGTTTTGPPIARGMSWRVNETEAAAWVPERPIVGMTRRVTLAVNLEVADFVRLLAKAGWAYAVGLHGLDAFAEKFLPRIILGDVEGGNTYVGGAASEMLPPRLPGDALHAMMARRHGDLVSVYIQLFREPGDAPPIYEVVVGRIAKSHVGPVI